MFDTRESRSMRSRASIRADSSYVRKYQIRRVLFCCYRRLFCELFVICYSKNCVFRFKNKRVRFADGTKSEVRSSGLHSRRQSSQSGLRARRRSRRTRAYRVLCLGNAANSPPVLNPCVPRSDAGQNIPRVVLIINSLAPFLVFRARGLRFNFSFLRSPHP